MGPSTEEQRKRALEHTRDALTQLKELLVKVDLPASAIDVAAEIYRDNLSGILLIEAHEHGAKRRAKIRVLTSAARGQLRGAGHYEMSGIPHVQPLMPGDFFDLHELTDEELDARIAKLPGTNEA